MGDDDVLVDLGGGVGKSVVGGVMIFNASQGFSVELSESRFARACRALERLEGAAASRACGRACRERAGRPGLIEMAHGDLMDFDLSAATVVLAFSTCYPLDFQARLQRKLLRELRLGARVYAPQHKGWDEGLVLGGRSLAPIPYDFGHAFRVEAVGTAPGEL
ncbi:unnamed protein product [Prorocentrum cordatum]|uniref:Histone-lysine N-methyltransferase, H3 lysine-79 specific n=1 Tax=Prorocentrum cordatum TaxID=2364126 RepID=A0ABN9VD68_9DINO|nr:unnamed protein product [Polarella glacialis]